MIEEPDESLEPLVCDPPCLTAGCLISSFYDKMCPEWIEIPAPPTPAPPTPSPDDDGRMLGLKVGLPIGLILLLVLFCAGKFFRRWRRQRGYTVMPGPGNASSGGARASSSSSSTTNRGSNTTATNNSIIRATRGSSGIGSTSRRTAGMAEPLLQAAHRLSGGPAIVDGEPDVARSDGRGGSSGSTGNSGSSVFSRAAARLQKRIQQRADEIEVHVECFGILNIFHVRIYRYKPRRSV